MPAISWWSPEALVGKDSPPTFFEYDAGYFSGNSFNCTLRNSTFLVWLWRQK